MMQVTGFKLEVLNKKLILVYPQNKEILPKQPLRAWACWANNRLVAISHLHVTQGLTTEQCAIFYCLHCYKCNNRLHSLSYSDSSVELWPPLSYFHLSHMTFHKHLFPSFCIIPVFVEYFCLLMSFSLELGLLPFLAW